MRPGQYLGSFSAWCAATPATRNTRRETRDRRRSIFMHPPEPPGHAADHRLAVSRGHCSAAVKQHVEEWQRAQGLQIWQHLGRGPQPYVAEI
eukprot:3819017-Prymnesium_polylepis.1